MADATTSAPIILLMTDDLIDGRQEKIAPVDWCGGYKLQTRRGGNEDSGKKTNVTWFIISRGFPHVWTSIITLHLYHHPSLLLRFIPGLKHISYQIILNQDTWYLPYPFYQFSSLFWVPILCPLFSFLVHFRQLAYLFYFLCKTKLY